MTTIHAETLRPVGRGAMRLALSALALMLVSQQLSAHAQQHLRETRPSVKIDWSVLDQLAPVASVETRREPTTRAVGRAASRTGKAVVVLKPATNSTRVGPNGKPAKNASTARNGRLISAKTASKPVDACSRSSVPETTAAAGSPKPIKSAIHEAVASSAALGGSPSASLPHAPPSHAVPSEPPLAPIALGPPEAQKRRLPSPMRSESGSSPN